jgi:hypothetical protein
LTEIVHPAALEQFSVALVALGAFVGFVAVVGYCAAARENRLLLVLVSYLNFSTSVALEYVDLRSEIWPATYVL